MQRLDLAPRVAAEEGGHAAVGPEQPEEDPERRGLARSVGPEEAVDLAGLDVEVEPVEGDCAAKCLRRSWTWIAEVMLSTIHRIHDQLNAMMTVPRGSVGHDSQEVR